MISKRFYLIFVVELIVIAGVSLPLFLAGEAKYLIPAIALIVGVHFLLLAGVFERRIDYFIGAAAVVAIIGILLVAFRWVDTCAAWTFVSAVTALGTTTYGLYMARAKRRMRARRARDVMMIRSRR